MSKQRGSLSDRYCEQPKPLRYGRYASHETLEKRLLLHSDSLTELNPPTEIPAQVSVLDSTEECKSLRKLSI